MKHIANSRIFKYGWVMAAIVAGVLGAAAFQAPVAKFGVVDLTRTLDQSDLGKANQEEFKTLKSSREAVLEFIDTYRVLTNDQAQRFRDLSLKTDRTPAEGLELDKLKSDVIAASKQAADLHDKPNMTPDERGLLEDYTRRSQAMEQLTQRWYNEFTNEMQSWADTRKQDSLAKARDAIQEVAKADGYTMVFEASIAPYGANDITDATLKAMNAKK